MIENPFAPVFGPDLENDFDFLPPEPEVETEPVTEPEPEPVPEPAPELEPEDPAPVEVVTVEDLLDHLAGETAEEGETEEPSQETEDAAAEAPAEAVEVPPAEEIDGSVVVAGMDTALERLETIQGAMDHPMMETPFEDYTVTEGLLLLVFVILLLDFFLNLLRRWL